MAEQPAVSRGQGVITPQLLTWPEFLRKMSAADDAALYDVRGQVVPLQTVSASSVYWLRNTRTNALRKIILIE
jgi:hypothetical protein